MARIKPGSGSPTRFIALAFLAIILLATALLALPISSRSGESCGLMAALFSATSVVCITGLSLFDTWSQWSAFGQVVIFCLIEIGGLGFMSAASLVVFILRKKVGLKQRLVMAQSLSLSDMDTVIRVQRLVLTGSLYIQAVGALILTLRFWPDYGFGKALRWGFFHAVSAFCNAGFDILGSIEPGSSLTAFRSDPVVLLTISALVVVGGLGFFVWQDIGTQRSFRKLSIYSKLVLITSGALLVLGMLVFCALEWNNPATLGTMSLADKLLNGFFHSVNVRSAGFFTLDQASLTEGSKAFSLVMMLIGGSSGSTAGGMKTVTVLVLGLFLWTRARGRENVTVFKRTIPNSQVLDAMTIVTTMAGLAIFGGIFICTGYNIPFIDAMYESVAAIATVGLSTGVTAQLGWAGRLLVMVYMYFGRVGVMTISLGFLMGNRVHERYRYAQTSLLIG